MSKAKTFELGIVLANRRGLEVTRVSITTYCIARNGVPLAWINRANHLWTAYLYIQEEDGSGGTLSQGRHTTRRTSLQWCLDHIKD